MGVYVRPDSDYYWLLLPRKNQKALRRKTQILHTAATAKQTKENKLQADIEFHAAMTALARGTFEPAPNTTPLLRDYWHHTYLPWLTANYPNAVQESTRVMHLFLPTMGDTQLSAIRPGLIKTWLDERGDITPQSKARELSHLRGLLTRAVEWEHLETHPLASLSLDAAPSREIIRYLSPDEHARLITALTARDDAARLARERFNAHLVARKKPPLPAIGVYSDHLHPMVLLSLYTGMRRGEVFQVSWPAIDWTAKIITVEWWTAKRNRKRAIKSRRIRLNKHAHGALETWHQQQGKPADGLIFPSHTGESFTNIDSSWEEVREAAALVNFRWHDLRHTFASWLAQRGTLLTIIQKLMGHASINTTMKYAHLAPDQAHDAVDGLES